MIGEYSFRPINHTVRSSWNHNYERHSHVLSKSIALKSVLEPSTTHMTGGHKISLDSQGGKEGKVKCEHSHRDFAVSVHFFSSGCS